MTLKITGMDNVLDLLKALPAEVSSKNGGVVRKALRKGAVIIQKEAKLNIQKIVAEPNKDGRPSESTGALAKSVKVTRARKVYGKGERFMVWLGGFKRQYANTKANVRSGKSGKSYMVELPNFYGRLLEYGTVKMRPHPWMRPAFYAKRQEALNIIIKTLKIEVEKLANKHLKKG